MPVIVHQHGDRDDGRRHQRRANIAEQREQHGDHEQRAFRQVLRHRLDGRIDERGPIVDRGRLHALGQ